MSKLILCRAALCISLLQAAALAQRAPVTKRPAPAVSKALSLASIEGDVYLVTKTGDVKKAAANTVRLVATTPELLVALDSTCAEITRDAKTIRGDSLVVAALEETIAYASTMNGRVAADLKRSADSSMKATLRDLATDRFLRESALKTAEDSLARHIVATAPTGINAHYRFADVKPAAYLLIATTDLGAFHYQWLATVVVAEGRAVTKDLDNSVLTEGLTYCTKR